MSNKRELGIAALIGLAGCTIAWLAGAFDERPDLRVSIQHVPNTNGGTEVSLLIIQSAERRKANIERIEIDNNDACFTLTGPALPRKLAFGLSIVGILSCEPVGVTIITSRGRARYPLLTPNK